MTNNNDDITVVAPPEYNPALAWSDDQTVAGETPAAHGRVMSTGLILLLAVVALAVAWLAATLFVHHGSTRNGADDWPPGTLIGPQPASTETVAPQDYPTEAITVALNMSAQTLVAPAPPPPVATVPTNDQRFLALVTQDGYRIDDAREAIAGAHMVCRNLAVTRNLWTTEQWLNQTVGVVEPNAHEITIDAATIYCPELVG
jgi:hypothetical protein